jgi:hypothetical protein
VNAGTLVTRWQMPLVGRTKRYDAGQVRHLRAATLAWPFAGFGRWNRAAYPPWFANAGSVQFDYGARTVRVLPGLDEAEGRMVAGSEAVRRTMAGEAAAGGGAGVEIKLQKFCIFPLEFVPNSWRRDAELKEPKGWRS